MKSKQHQLYASLRKSLARHVPLIKKIQAWWRAVRDRPKIMTAWINYHAAKRIYEDLTNRIIMLQQAPAIALQLIHFNKWNGNFKLKGQQFNVSVLSQIFYSISKKVIEQQGKQAINQATKAIAEHIVNKKRKQILPQPDISYLQQRKYNLKVHDEQSQSLFQKAALLTLIESSVRQVLFETIEQQKQNILLDLKLKPLLFSMVDQFSQQIFTETLDDCAADLILKDMIDQLLAVKPRKYAIQSMQAYDLKESKKEFQTMQRDVLDRLLFQALATSQPTKQDQVNKIQQFKE